MSQVRRQTTVGMRAAGLKTDDSGDSDHKTDDSGDEGCRHKTDDIGDEGCRSVIRQTTGGMKAAGIRQTDHMGYGLQGTGREAGCRAS